MKNFKLVVIADPDAIEPKEHIVINFDNELEADEYQTDLISSWLTHDDKAVHDIDEATVVLSLQGEEIKPSEDIEDEFVEMVVEDDEVETDEENESNEETECLTGEDVENSEVEDNCKMDAPTDKEFKQDNRYEITIEIQDITVPPTENLEVQDFIVNAGYINLPMPQIDPQYEG